MRGRKKAQGMKRGMTIVAERERAESESERMQARRQAKRKRRVSVFMGLLLVAVVALSAYLGFRELENRKQETLEQAAKKAEITVPVIDEEGKGRISERVRTYIAELEREFARKGYTVERVTLPTGMIRAVYVDLEGKEMFLKMDIDRGVGESVEDAKRMLEYLEERGITPGEYVDVRVEGKGYYK